MSKEKEYPDYCRLELEPADWILRRDVMVEQIARKLARSYAAGTLSASPVKASMTPEQQIRRIDATVERIWRSWMDEARDVVRLTMIYSVAEDTVERNKPNR